MKTNAMRHLPFFLCLFASCLLQAQNKSQPYYQNVQEPPTQKALRSDCYLRKYDAGLSAGRRGDYRAALRLFEEAKLCPEVVGNSRREKDLADKIEYCNELVGGKSAITADKAGARKVENIELTGRKFNRSAVFTRNTDPNCFKITMQEADRAFRDSCWDDAAKLYRAAKSCADANQTDRERMSQRIEACEEAAKDELLQKEQKAIRTARHALAANRANDAMDLLHQGNRSLAWRLADFANYYIAPDDNPDCLDAMYSAYFYKPSEADSSTLRPPFCYQIAENLGANVQYKFSSNDFGELLTAFIPSQSRTITWQLPSMKIVESFSLGILKDPIGFDFAPNGGLLFYGTNYFYLPNGEKLDVSAVTKYCFSEDSNYFLYEDVANGVINIINLDLPVRGQQRKNANNYIGRASSPQAGSYPITSSLLDMRVYHGELWLGYRDRVEVVVQQKGTGNFLARMTWNLADTLMQTAGILSMHLYPATREVILGNESASYYYFLHQPPEDSTQESVTALTKMQGQLQACSPEASPLLVAVCTNAYGFNGAEFMTIYAPFEKATKARFNTSTGLGLTISANISPSERWMMVQDANGHSNLWALQDTSMSPPVAFETATENQLSPDGNLLFIQDDNRLKIYDFDDLKDGAQQEVRVLPEASLPEGGANKWAVYRCKEGEISLEQLNTKQVLNFEAQQLPDYRIPFAFDDTEARFFAYSSGSGVVTVKSLTSKLSMATRDFGGMVTLIKSIPGTDKLLVVTRSDQFMGARYTVKVWDFSKPGESPRVVRLQDYNVQMAQVSEQGDRIALSNTGDIRIFLLENLDNEAVVIKPSKNGIIYDLAFRPDGLAVAAGDSDGRISIWDVTTGQALHSFSNVWEGQEYPVYRLAFAYGGTRLRLVSPNRLFTANLDAYSLRDIVQSGDHWLTSFSPEQIRQYNLEIAFKFPGNFDRLAESSDFPLILSFFKYFREQSISSNNIAQVSTYCQRASTLYELLDANGQVNAESTLLEMFGDYALKLLLRNKPTEAAQLVAYMDSRFKKPDIALLDGAHTALVQHDLNTASKRYNDYLLRLSGDPYFIQNVADIGTTLSQFQEYDLLDSSQIYCLCGVFQQFNTFQKLCPPGIKFPTPAYTTQILKYQRIYSVLDSVAYWVNRMAKMKVLEQTYAFASTLPYPNPNVKKHPLDTLVVALASTYMSMADFELNAPKTPGYYKRAVDLLEKTIALTSAPDTAQLNRLILAYFSWGKYFLAIDNPEAAAIKFNAALEAGNKMNSLYGAGAMGDMMSDDRNLSPVYEELCKAKLLAGKPQEARNAFEQAEQLANTRLRTTLLGQAALLENNDIEAFLEYGKLETGADLGDALFQIYRMADLLPGQRDQLRAFAPRLQTAFLSLHPDISPDEVTYWCSTLQMTRYGVIGKQDSALAWSTVATNSLDKLMAEPAKAKIWRENWLSQRINQAYYLLCAHYADTSALSEVIRYSNEALAWIEAEDPYSNYKSYVYTNLAHAYWLRNQPGDRKKAVDGYIIHLTSYIYLDDTWELLVKDFRDLHRIGVNWPDLKNLIQQIKPEDAVLSPEDWHEMGGL